MGSVIKNQTKDGEITINLNLTIKLDGENLFIETKANKAVDKVIVEKVIEKENKKDDFVTFEIPDFTCDDNIINFGKKAGE